MAEEDELDFDIADLESFLDNFDIGKTNDLLDDSTQRSTLAESDASQTFSRQSSYSQSSDKRVPPEWANAIKIKPFVPTKPVSSASSQPTTTVHPSVSQNYSIPLNNPVEQNGFNYSVHQEYSAPPEQFFTQEYQTPIYSEPSFANPLSPPKDSKTSLLPQENSAENPTNFKNPLTSSNQSTTDPHVYSNPLFNNKVDKATNEPTQISKIDQIQFKFPEHDPVNTTVTTPPRNKSSVQSSNNGLKTPSSTKKSNLRLPSKEDVSSCTSTSSEKSTRRVSFGAVTTFDEDLPRIQKPQRRIAFNAIAGIKNHIISHNIKATPIPPKQLETLHMPDLVQLKDKKRRNSKTKEIKKEPKIESVNETKPGSLDAESAKTDKTPENELEDDLQSISSQPSQVSLPSSSCPTSPISMIQLPADDLSEDGNFTNQDPELLSQIFFKKAMSQANRSRQLAEICQKLSKKVDNFLPCLLRQLQKQYNSRRELSAERFTGFAAFLIQCWALINNPVDNKRFKKLDIPVAILYQELVDNSKFKLGTARHFYPIFRDCAMFLPEQLLDSYVMPKLRNRLLETRSKDCLRCLELYANKFNQPESTSITKFYSEMK